MWHASVAVLSSALQRTLTAEEAVGMGLLSIVVRTLRELLSGVGMVPSSIEAHPLAIHYRRSLTDEEVAQLPAAWCAIPAVHEGGRGVVLEENT